LATSEELPDHLKFVVSLARVLPLRNKLLVKERKNKDEEENGTVVHTLFPLQAW
jgi:hypothetical protein